MTSPTPTAFHAAQATPAAMPALMSDAERRAVLPQAIGGLDIERLQQFKGLMAAEDEPVQIGRMLFDRLYAYERIACAHASAQEPLRRLALGLFQTCRRSDEARNTLR